MHAMPIIDQTFEKRHGVSSTSSLLEKTKNRMYRCEFSAAMDLISSSAQHAATESAFVELQLMYSTALYEVMAVSEAREHLENLSANHKFQCRASYHYALGKLSYFDANYEEALRLFETIDRLTVDPVLRFRGLLGVANVHYSLEAFEAMVPKLARLEQLKHSVQAEDQISHLILLGNYYRMSEIDRVLANKYYQKALELASSKAWTYFIQRALYGQACVALHDQKTLELRVILNILKGLSEQNESAYFRKLLQEKFSKVQHGIGVESDVPRMRIQYKGITIDLSDRPLIFAFFRELENQVGFVTKVQVAKALWPNEKYLTHTHDARIFDLAKRIRKILSENFGESIELISNRMGYRLINSAL